MPRYEFEGKHPVCHPSAWIAPSADVIGEVILGEDVGVWFGAVIRGDNNAMPVGARTNIQEGAMLHSDADAPLTIGTDCTIGHHAILHGCTIGDRVLVGMGAVVLNHAVIGDDCVIGAGALVTERKTFPARSLIVGSPARVVRMLDDAAVAALKASAAHYVAKARAAVESLRRLD